MWRQDHNGFSHQDPGFIDHVVNKKAEVVRVYLPPDTNTLLSTMRHCLESQHYVNVVVAGKQPQFDWLDAEAADLHCARGLGIWDWASHEGDDPDVVIACAGDVPTLEALAATKILRERLPDLKIRFVNVVDLMRLQDDREHPHGLTARDFDTVFTVDKPVIFAYHGYPWLIHRLTYRRTNHDNIHVRGYKEEGTTTTPFDMVMMNDLDRFHLVMDVIDRVPSLGLARRSAAAGDGRPAAPGAGVDARARRGPARGERLVVGRRRAGSGRVAVDDRGAGRRRATGPERQPSRARTCRAIASSSSVGTTRTVTGDEFGTDRAWRPRPRSGCSSVSSSSPRAPRSASAASRTRGDVLADPGGEHDGVAPPSTARYAPTYLRSRWQ